VWQNGKFVPGVPGVTKAYALPGEIIFTVQNGDYRFQIVNGKSSQTVCQSQKQDGVMCSNATTPTKLSQSSSSPPTAHQLARPTSATASARAHATRGAPPMSLSANVSTRVDARSSSTTTLLGILAATLPSPSTLWPSALTRGPLVASLLGRPRNPSLSCKKRMLFVFFLM